MDKNRRAFGEIATSSSDIWLALKRCCHCMIPGIWGVQMGGELLYCFEIQKSSTA